MNNKSTDINDTTKPRNEIKLTGIEIDEPENDETAVTVVLQVPYEFYLCGRRSLDEYEKIAMEDLRIKASAIFEHIRLLNHLVENRDFEQNSFASILYPLTDFGKGLIELQEIVQMSFERYREGLPQKHEIKPADNQRQTQTAEPEIKIPPPTFPESTVKAARNHICEVTANKLHHALTSDKVSTEIKVAIEDILTTASNETMDVNIYHPALVKTAFLLMMGELERNYAKGVLHSIQSILDTLPVEVREEFTQYEKHISETEVTAKPPLKFTDEDDDEKTVQIGDLAVSLNEVLNNPQIPVEIYDALMSALNDLFGSLPSNKRTRLTVDETYLTDLLTYHAQAEEKEAEEKDVLDLSEMSSDSLNTNDSPSLESLAKQLSDVMNNPLLPKRLYSVIGDEISSIGINIHSPENVLHNLEELSEKEA